MQLCLPINDYLVLAQYCAGMYDMILLGFKVAKMSVGKNECIIRKRYLTFRPQLYGLSLPLRQL